MLFVSMFMSACSVNAQSCALMKGWGEGGDQPQPPGDSQPLPPPADHGASETDTVAFVSTGAGSFAVAAIRPANEVRVYRVDANDTDEDPLTLRFVGSVHLAAPAHVTADDRSHARVTLADATTVTIDPLTLAPAESSRGDAPQLEDSVAYATGGDAWLDDERVQGPGVTRAVALADVRAETKTRRVLVLQTVEPRMLVFFTTKDPTMPSAFEPLN